MFFVIEWERIKVLSHFFTKNSLKNNKTDIPQIVITEVGQWKYFGWFILGFYLLHREGLVKLKFRLPLIYYLLIVFSSSSITRFIGVIIQFFYGVGSYNLKGYIEYESGLKCRSFTIDCADSPFSFDGDALEKTFAYFKMQCPKRLDTDGFPIIKSVILPWVDHSKSSKINHDIFHKLFLANRYKIKPLMVGPRRLGYGLSYKELIRGYQNIISSRKLQKRQKFMCYFGNSKGPVATYVKNGELNLNSESQLMGFLGERASHPNEKRYIVSDILKKFDKSDARLITLGNSDSRNGSRIDASIPLKDFYSHVANFEYNLNVSGYRLSIPNRFIESFAVGTAVVTDNLFLRWYQPFSKYEVIETVDMGYEKVENVDFESFEFYLQNLPHSIPENIVDDFEKKWQPIEVAKYLIQSTIGNA